LSIHYWSYVIWHDANKLVCYMQGCGLGLDVSVSRRTNVSSPEKLSTSRSRLGLGLLSAIYISCQGAVSRWRRTQCERVL